MNKHKKMEYNVIQIQTVKVKLENGISTSVKMFYRQKVKFYWCRNKKKFIKVKPFIKQTVKNLLNNKDCIWADEVEKALIDKNNLVFPLPSFKQMFK